MPETVTMHKCAVCGAFRLASVADLFEERIKK